MFCWYFRLMISHAMDRDGHLSIRTQRHVSHCVSCRGFYEGCQLLGEGLRREAAASKCKVSRRLSESILTAIGNQRTEPRTIKLRPVLAAACVALVISTGILFLMGRRDKPEVSQPPQAEPVAAFRALVGEDFWMEWSEPVSQPLADELQNLVGHTEAAARFLVACLDVDIVDIEANQRVRQSYRRP